MNAAIALEGNAPLYPPLPTLVDIFVACAQKNSRICVGFFLFMAFLRSDLHFLDLGFAVHDCLL
jgi:hypothetical protein